MPRRVLSSRHIVTTASRLKQLVRDYREFDSFAFDTETVGTAGRSPLDTRTNEVIWVSLAGPGRADVIPCGHPHGRLLASAKKVEIVETDEEREDRLALPKDDSRRQKKRRYRVVPEKWEDPPRQLPREAVFDALEPLFFSERRAVGHNVKFDLQTISKYYGGEFPPLPFGDTHILQHALNENLTDVRHGRFAGGYGLDDLCKRHFAFEYEQLGKAGVQNFPFLTAARYAYLDARMDWALWRFLLPGLEKEQVESVFDLEMEVLETLLPLEMWGCLIDGHRIADLDVTMNSRLVEIHQRIQRQARKLGMDDFNVRSNPQKQRLVYDVLGHPVTETTAKGGNPSTSAKVLQRLATKEPIIADMMEYAEVEKIHGTYIVGMLKHLDPETSRLHANFKQVGTKTGRFSCVAADSLIEMPRDLVAYPEGVPITEVRKGDWVYAFDWRRELVLKQVKWVAQTGIKQTVVVTVENSEKHRMVLRLTPEHLVRLRHGDWRPAGSLDHRWGGARRDDGPRVMTMVRRCVDDGYIKFFPHSIARQHGVKSGGMSREHRWVVEQITGRRVSTKADVHHVDGNRANNHPENLQKLTVAEHRGRREVHPRWGVHKKPPRLHTGPTDYRVVSVEPGPVEAVWDMEVEDVHNFIANGVCVHNCSDPNLQNIPRKTSKEGKEIRSLFVAPKGMVLVCGDYSQIEVRLLAHYSREEALIEAFRRGEDIHRIMASKIFKVPPEEVTDAQRSTGKTANFAIIYGAGPKRILEQDEHIKGEEEARQILEQMWAGLRKAKDWTDAVVAECRAMGSPIECSCDDPWAWWDKRKKKCFKRNPKTGNLLHHMPYVRTIAGRKRRLPDILLWKDRDRALRGYAQRQAVNTKIQGSAADIMKMAMVRLHRMIVGTDFHLILTVHDELVMESPKALAIKGVELMREAMEDVPLKLRVPLVADIGVGERWSDAKA